MVKKIRWPILSLIACYFFFLILYLPASMVVNWLSLPSNIKLAGINGSIWHGNINRLIVNDSIINALEWRIGFSGIYPVVHLFSSDENISGKANLIWKGDWLIRDIKLNILADYLQGISNLAIPMLIQGNFYIDIDQIAFSGNTCKNIDGTIYWQHAGVKSLVGTIDLGNSFFKTDCQQGQLFFIFTQESDAVTTTATIRIFEDNYWLDALLTPGNLFPPLLLESLNNIGIKDKQGVFNINTSGQL